MQFSDTINKNGLIQIIEDHTELGDGVISGDTTLLKKFTSRVNEALYDITTEIMLLSDSFEWDDPYKTDFPIATTPLAADRRDFQFDNLSFLKIKRVDVTYDRVNWYRATPFTSTQYLDGMGNDTQVDERFDKKRPMYDAKSFGFWLYPRASAEDVENGAKARIEFVRTHDEFVYTDTTKEMPIDRNFHEMVAVGAALRYPSLSDKQYQKLTTWYQGKSRQLVGHYSQRNEDRFLTLTNPSLPDYH